jgi:hypothetical protein
MPVFAYETRLVFYGKIQVFFQHIKQTMFQDASRSARPNFYTKYILIVAPLLHQHQNLLIQTTNFVPFTLN